jgi:hypothetical protein
MKMSALELVEQIAEAVDGTVYHGYSGRGMYGAKCLGVTCGDATRCIEEAASRGLMKASTDNMGRDMIVYWPHLDNEEEQVSAIDPDDFDVEDDESDEEDE